MNLKAATSKAIVVIAGSVVAVSLTACAPEATPTPNPTASALQAKQLAGATDDFQKNMAENLAKSTPVLGKTQADAEKYLESIGLRPRVVFIDGVGQTVTADLSNARIDLSLEHGIVVDITVG